jgi:DNA-binding transcriptional regulator GbsR (MarR family)
MKIKKKLVSLKAQQFPELSKLADLIGEFIRYWGFKSIHGRIWTYLYFSKTSLNTHQLTQVLKISNPLVSRSVAELLEYKVILAVEKGVNGVLCFTANPDVTQAIVTVLKQREKKMLTMIESHLPKLKQPKKRNSMPLIDEGKIQLVEQWIKLAQSYLDLALSFGGTEFDPFTHPEKHLEEFESLEIPQQDQ